MLTKEERRLKNLKDGVLAELRRIENDNRMDASIQSAFPAGDPRRAAYDDACRARRVIGYRLSELIEKDDLA